MTKAEEWWAVAKRLSSFDRVICAGLFVVRAAPRIEELIPVLRPWSIEGTAFVDRTWGGAKKDAEPWLVRVYRTNSLARGPP